MEKLYELSAEKLFKRYYARLCHFAWQFLGDQEHAEDIVQDAFMAYWDHKAHIASHEDAVKNFLYSSVRNGCLNAVRRGKVADRYASRIAGQSFEEAQVLARIIRSEVMDEVNRIMQGMPLGCKEVFRLGYLEGLSNSQIAEQLQISINTVKTQKQRGLKLLRAKLNPEFFALIAALYVA